MNRNSRWWGPPKKFTTDITQRKISWLELFYDLVYVIVISRITQRFAQHANLDGFLYYAFLFCMIFWGWLNGSMYYDIHGTPGIRTNLTTLWQMLAVAAVAVTLNFENDPNYFYLTMTLAFLQVYITYLWWSVGIYDKEHRQFNKPFNICYLSALALLIAAMYVPAPYKTYVYWLAILINFLPSVFIHQIMKINRNELNLSPSMTERLGLFTIIIFGEVILGVINGMHASSGHGSHIWLGFSLGILIVFSLWLIFFSLVADRGCKPGFLKGQYFQFLFMPTLLSLGIIGASFSVMLPAVYIGDYHIPENTRLFFGFSIAVFLICVNRMTRFLVYEEKYGNPKYLFAVILLVPAILISGITLFSAQISLLRFFACIFLVLLAMIIAITYSWNRVEKDPEQ
jgi:low temperature requirement protein LtrA